MPRVAVFSLIALAVACSSKTTPTGPTTQTGPTAPKSWLVGDNGLMVSINSSGELRVRAQLTSASLNSLICVDEYTAWAVGAQGQIFYTTDSGTHWLNQTSGTTATLYSVSFSNAQHGVAAGAAGTLLETDDGGAHWQPAAVATALVETRAYRAVVLLSASGAGIAVGDAGLMSWTSDGGRTWSVHASPGAMTLTGVDLNDDDVAVAVGQAGAAFRIDHDGVQTLAWSDASGRDLAAVRFMRDGDHLVAVGARGTIIDAQLSTATVAMAANPSPEDLVTVAVFGGEQTHYDENPNVGVMAAGANGAIVYRPQVSAPFEVVPSHSATTIRSLDELSGD